jgi:transketolase
MTHAEFALAARKDVLRMLHNALESHIGSCYSCIDIMTVLYNGVMNYDPKNPQLETRDKFLLGKGHAVASLYAVLARVGYFPIEDLNLYCKDGTDYQGHSRRDFVPGIEVSAGSLGHAINIGTGMAYANRVKDNDGKIFVLMGDGECNEGSVWEGAMFAAKWKLSNLVAIVDRNMLQSYGSDEQVLDMGDLAGKFRAFGWNAVDVDGHDYDLLEKTFKGVYSNKSCSPTVVIAHTTKGKGISFMENKLEWHFYSPKKEHFDKGMEELNNEK